MHRQFSFQTDNVHVYLKPIVFNITMAHLPDDMIIIIIKSEYIFLWSICLYSAETTSISSLELDYNM